MIEFYDGIDQKAKKDPGKKSDMVIEQVEIGDEIGEEEQISEPEGNNAQIDSVQEYIPSDSPGLSPSQNPFVKPKTKPDNQSKGNPPASVMNSLRAPLAERMRAKRFEDFLGQEHILGRGKMLRKSLENDNFHSFILWGPPGCGKTTLSRIIQSVTRGHFVRMAAVTVGVKEVREVVKEAKVRKTQLNQKTILFLDEIHRFNKAQQDVLLPHVERGDIILIGATTENPYFAIITPLISRTRVFKMEALTEDHLKKIIKRALGDKEQGLGGMNVHLSDEAMDFLIQSCGGDSRIALNSLESAVEGVSPGEDGIREITSSHIMDAMQSKKVQYDKTGDQHYDVISAFIKSIRGSDPDAAIYWMARMLHAGEDPRFIARRLIISASEDIGLADPFAMTIASSAAQAVQLVGLPECAIPLAEATIYLACAPKSNSVYKALGKAQDEVANNVQQPVPLHLRNAAHKGLKQFGFGVNYKYPHDYPGHFVQEQYLPDNLKDQIFYEPGEEGFEKKIQVRLRGWWKEV